KVFTNYILVHPKPEAGFDVDPASPNILYPLVNVTDGYAGAIFCIYYFGDGDSSLDANPSHLYGAIGEYELMQIVSSQFQCFDTLVRKIKIEGAFSIYIPNCFTPNGDGKNDLFQVYGFEVDQFSMNIFNRWGELVFHSD